LLTYSCVKFRIQPNLVPGMHIEARILLSSSCVMFQILLNLPVILCESSGYAWHIVLRICLSIDFFCALFQDQPGGFVLWMYWYVCVMFQIQATLVVLARPIEARIRKPLHV
jgi:hypothetical protein